MPWNSDAELKSQFAAALDQYAPRALAGHWERVIPLANETGRAVILDCLVRRGYTAAQIVTWRALQAFHAAQSLFYGLPWCGALNEDGLSNHPTYDRREALATVVLEDANGLPIIPNYFGMVGFGVIQHHDDLDQFTYPGGSAGQGEFRPW